MTNTSQVHRHSTFLTALPPEIRNDICERLLIHRRPINIVRGQSERATRVLLDVCRQLKDEFSCLYYHQNIFTCQCTDSDLDRELESTTSLIQWLRRIGLQNRTMLSEIQIRILSRRDFTKTDLFGFLRDQNVRLGREARWLPLSIVRVRHEDDWLNQVELSEMILKEEVDEEIDTLEQTGSALPKGPDLIQWKRELWDPVIDKHSKPDNPLSAWVCPATWQYHAQIQADTNSDMELEVLDEKGTEPGCLSGGFKVLMAKIDDPGRDSSQHPEALTVTRLPYDRRNPPNMSESPLLKLPPELRNSIYKDVLVEKGRVAVYRPDDLNPKHRWKPPALLQVCQQMREEASSIYYGLNTFRFPLPTMIRTPRSQRHLVLLQQTQHKQSIAFPNPDCVTVVSAWLILLGRTTSKLLHTIQLGDFCYHIEQVEERVAECREHLSKKGVPVPAAKVEVELYSEHYSGKSCVWLRSSFDEVLESLPKTNSDGMTT